MPSGDTDIQFKKIGIGSVLKDYQLRVPLNQREYAWTTKEVETLFKDFRKAMDEGVDYFLGTIVVIPRAGGSLEVSDGQQRLATTAILLSVMRDYLKSRDTILADALNEFLAGVQRRSRVRQPKLTLNVDDNDFFRARIAGEENPPPPTKPSHNLLQEAFDKAREYLGTIVAGLDEKDHGDELNRWIDFVQWNAIVGLLEVQNEASAYRMFETLNDRGLRTSQADLVKNYLYGRAGERLPEIQQKWTLMRGILEGMEDEDITTILFLRHALTVLYGLVRQADIYTTVETNVKAAQPAIAFAGAMEALASTYVSIHSHEHERWNLSTDATRRAIEVLNLFDLIPMRPLMLALAQRFTDREETERAFRFCVTLCVRLMFVGGTRTGATEEGVAEAARKVYGREIKNTDDLIVQLRPMTPNDERFRLAFEGASVSNQRLARYYLRSLEMAAKDEADPWHIPNDDKNVINLEHVLPIRPTSSWPQFTDELAKIFYRRVGNLALLRAKENSSLKSSEFITKKEVYSQSPYILTQQIASADEWTPAVITQRQKTLADYALKAWPLPWK